MNSQQGKDAPVEDLIKDIHKTAGSSAQLGLSAMRHKLNVIEVNETTGCFLWSEIDNLALWKDSRDAIRNEGFLCRIMYDLPRIENLSSQQIIDVFYNSFSASAGEAEMLIRTLVEHLLMGEPDIFIFAALHHDTVIGCADIFAFDLFR